MTDGPTLSSAASCNTDELVRFVKIFSHSFLIKHQNQQASQHSKHQNWPTARGTMTANLEYLWCNALNGLAVKRILGNLVVHQTHRICHHIQQERHTAKEWSGYIQCKHIYQHLNKVILNAQNAKKQNTKYSFYVSVTHSSFFLWVFLLVELPPVTHQDIHYTILKNYTTLWLDVLTARVWTHFHPTNWRRIFNNFIT